jgi:outer membrane immunogenic protein
MRKLLLGSIALFALSVGSPAVAADMPVKARPAPPPPIYNWSGCYFGGFVGYATGRADVHYGTQPIGFEGLQATDDIHLSGATGGFNGGCQYQAGWWLIGVEVDGSALNKSGQRPEYFPFTNFIVDVKETWLATARLRLGLTWDKWLFYVTGGGAWARFDVANWNFLAPVQAIHDVQTRSGWVVGAGTEYALGYGWSLKSEFLYVEFERTRYFSNPNLITGADFDIRVRNFISRVGLNYKFDWGKAPVAVMAKY